jgi:hypothetical protein
MSADDAFCPECGTHVVDQARITGDETTLPGAVPPRSISPAPPSESAYDRPYERLDDTQAAHLLETSEPPTEADGEPVPFRTFDAPVEASDDVYEDYPETPAPRFSPVMVGLAAVFMAIIVAGIIVALAGRSDGGGSSGGGGGLVPGRPVSAGGFGSMLPDGTLVCTKGTEAYGSGARTAVAGAIEVLAAPATWSSRDLVKGRFQGTGAGIELALNASDHERVVPQSARISVFAVEPNVASFPDQFLAASVPSGNATTVSQDCVEYGPYTALRVQRVELSSGGTLSTRYVALHDKARRGNAVLFVFEDPRNSKPDADFFDSMVASAKLLR